MQDPMTLQHNAVTHVSYIVSKLVYQHVVACWYILLAGSTNCIFAGSTFLRMTHLSCNLASAECLTACLRYFDTMHNTKRHNVLTTCVSAVARQ